MAWLSSVSWVTGDTPVLATVLNNIGADIRAWGGNVDGGGYNLANVANITASAKIKAGQHFQLPADAGYEWWAGPFTDLVSFQITRRKTDGSAFTNPLTVLTGGNVGIGTLLPTSALHVVGLATHASNAAAIAAGKTAGAFYTDGAGAVKVVY